MCWHMWTFLMFLSVLVCDFVMCYLLLHVRSYLYMLHHQKHNSPTVINNAWIGLHYLRGHCRTDTTLSRTPVAPPTRTMIFSEACALMTVLSSPLCALRDTTRRKYLWSGFGFPFFLMLFVVVSLKCSRPTVTLVTWSGTSSILW